MVFHLCGYFRGEYINHGDLLNMDNANSRNVFVFAECCCRHLNSVHYYLNFCFYVIWNLQKEKGTCEFLEMTEKLIEFTLTWSVWYY